MVSNITEGFNEKSLLTSYNESKTYNNKSKMSGYT